MLFKILMFANLAFSYVGEPLGVRDVDYIVGENEVSCALLKYRSRERDKVIRETIYAKDYDDTHKRFMNFNYLSNNKFFLDKRVWTDESILVSMEASVTEELREEIGKVGFENLYLSLKGVGIKWSSMVFNFPEDFKILYNHENSRVDISYRIYQSEHCFKELVAPELTWVSHQVEDIGEFMDSAKVAKEVFIEN